MIDREEFEKACPVPEGVYWESWGNGDGQYEAVSPEHEEFADVQQARLHGWQAARAQSGQGAEPVAVVELSDYIHLSGASASQRKALKEVSEGSIQSLPVGTKLYTHPQPAQQGSVPEVFMRLFEHARGLSFGHDWNKGTAQSYHRKPLLESVEECKRYLATPQPVGDGWIPEGWKLVPIEPTPDMRRAFHKAHELFENGEEVDGSPDDEWRAMLAAAPQPPKQEGE